MIFRSVFQCPRKAQLGVAIPNIPKIPNIPNIPNLENPENLNEIPVQTPMSDIHVDNTSA